jgi:hypothetical protein
MMDGFSIAGRKGDKNWGKDRTTRVGLEIYDESQAAMTSVRPYQRRLEPPPAAPRCCHLLRAEEVGSTF